MDGAIASFAVEKVGDLIIREWQLLNGVRDEVKQLRTELERMQIFLETVAQRNIEDKRVRKYVVEIQGVAYEAEDVIQTYILKVESESRVGVLNALGEAFTHHNIGSEIKALNVRISNITRSVTTYGIDLKQEAAQRSNSRLIHLRRSYSHVEEEDIVGLDNDAEQLVDALVTSKKHVAIWGMGGLGKTTLAKKIYRHSRIRAHFKGFSWTCISQQWKPKDVLHGLLIGLKCPSDKERKVIDRMTFDELAKQLYEFQKTSKCLVVLDDVWSPEALQSISGAFPRTKSISKILLTTRNKDVAAHIRTHMGQDRVLHEPRFLNKEESWDLFQKKALSRRDATDFQLKIGREIAGGCKGLPLAIVVLGGILATKETIQEWETVLRDLRGKQSGDVMQMLDLSYSDLPYYLKPCFLYLGQYPKDSQIRVESLVRKWVAEGIVSSRHHNQHNGANKSMEDVAKGYLDELAERCMVQLQFTKQRQRVKSCRLHDLVREFCLSKLRDHEDFLKVVCFDPASSSAASSSTGTTSRTRRLAICVDFLKVVCFDPASSSAASSSTGTTSRTRRLAICVDPASSSIDSFCEENYIKMTSTHDCHYVRSIFFPNVDYFSGRVEILFKGFDFLRVLDFEGMWRMDKEFPEEIGKLVHLRYLSLRRSVFYKLPSSIENLRCLETLDLQIFGYMDIPNVLWKLENLRHLYLPLEMKVYDKLRLDTLKNLETLVNFHDGDDGDDKACDVMRMPQLNNLRELKGMRIRPEHLGITLDSLSSSVSSLISSNSESNTMNRLQYSSFIVEGYIKTEEQQDQMRQLLTCHHLHKLKMRGSLKKLPEYEQLSPKIIRLWLDNTFLKEDPMPTLEKLPHLKFLYLDKSSYLGKELVCSALRLTTTVQQVSGGFPQLRELRLRGLRNLEEWKVEEGAMPTLCSIEIDDCEKLKEIPSGLESITTLKMLRVTSMPDEFMSKLREDDLYKKLQH